MSTLTTTTTASLAGPLDIYRSGETSTIDSWLVSDWTAGQTRIMDWSASNVRTAADGATELVLDDAPSGSLKPFHGAEIQSNKAATTGTWTWEAQAPRMVDGAVFGMFVYPADWANAPWVEFDYEFVGADTTKVQLTVHMEDAAGNHVMNLGKVVIDLGFDAALAVHSYEITLTGTSADYRVDGSLIASLDASDMPGGIWSTGNLKSYADLWAADSRYNAWSGTWTDPGVPLVARIEDAAVLPGVVPALPALMGGLGDDVITGTALGDRIDGRGGQDTLQGGAGGDEVLGRAGDDRLEGGDGDDVLLGGDGRDWLGLDAGNDRIDGGAGTDWVFATGTGGVTLQLGARTLLATGQGMDLIVGIENAQGAGGHDRITGTTGSNVLDGGAGNDVLRGEAGADRLLGGQGCDQLDGGADLVRDVFVLRSARDSAPGSAKDVIRNFTPGLDDIDLSGIDVRSDLDGDQSFAFAGTTARAHAVWAVKSGMDLILRGDATGDRTADFEIKLVAVGALTVDDFIF